MLGNTHEYTWKFYRIGGLDQVTLRTAEELLRLDELDPKLWVALSCPASGLEFNARTLALIDSDGDGRIRIPEILEAVKWLTTRLENPQDMAGDAPEALPLEQIAAETDEGRRLSATAASILAGLGKADAAAISYADVCEALQHASGALFNGDGVHWANPELGSDAVGFITDALAVVGGVMDASGNPGIDAGIATAFMETLRAWEEWQKTVHCAAAPFGEHTASAWQLLQELAPKFDDYFLRCDMASFAPWALGEHREEEHSVPDYGLLEMQTLAEMPLARIEPERPLSFLEGLNPAWRERVVRFASYVAPLLPQQDAMSREDWQTVQNAFLPYEAVIRKKPGIAEVAAPIAPQGCVGDLSPERIRAILTGTLYDDVIALLQKDADAPAAATDIADLERLVLFHAHLYHLLMNFVSFYDFYSLRRKAIFQFGTLFLDGRSCALCLPVSDPAKHASLAASSQLCLVYCQCTRVGATAPGEEETMNIVAAVTAGSADMLVEGRNGVFVDTSGGDWDATVTRVVSNPINMRQAVWDPYRRVGRIIAEQVSKFAADKQASVTKNLGAAAGSVASGKQPAQPFDIGKSVGVFAAVGIALGALGTAVGSIMQALTSLAWWQFPLVFGGAFILSSGPSMVLAWLKLRKRTLGPLLEASGWAVNSLVPVNFTLGRKLTATAELPPNATRCYDDPLGQPKRWPWLWVCVLVVAAGVGIWAWLAWPNWPSWPDVSKLGISAFWK